MKQLEWRAAQDIRGLQRDLTQRARQRITSGLGAVATSLAIYDLTWLLAGMH